MKSFSGRNNFPRLPIFRFTNSLLYILIESRKLKILISWGLVWFSRHSKIPKIYTSNFFVSLHWLYGFTNYFGIFNVKFYLLYYHTRSCFNLLNIIFLGLPLVFSTDFFIFALNTYGTLNMFLLTFQTNFILSSFVEENIKKKKRKKKKSSLSFMSMVHFQPFKICMFFFFNLLWSYFWNHFQAEIIP